MSPSHAAEAKDRWRESPPAPPPRKPPTRTTSGGRRFLTAACVLLGCFFLLGSLPAKWRDSLLNPTPQAAAPAPVLDKPEYLTANIEDIEPGDTVLAMDPATGQVVERRVLNVFRRTTDRLRVLAIRDAAGATQTLKTTDEHPFWVASLKDFKPAGQLRLGDQFLGPKGEVQTLVSTTVEQHPEGVPVYNFEVGKKRCQEPFCARRGRPRGRNTDSRPNRLVIRSTHSGVPKG